MDSIFEEDAEEVGGEIEAYCPSPRCKADTTHTIISMYEDEVRRVQCVVCGEVHAYRKPRGDGLEEGGETAKKASQRRMTWDDAMARATDNDLNNCRPYSIRDAYEEGDVVLHPVFDVGFVVELLPDNKVEIIFRDGGSKILVHNRGDLATRMPGISEVPVPREAKKKKRAKKPEPAAAPLQSRSKAEVEAAVQRARAAAQLRTDESQKGVDERSSKLKADAKKPAAKKAEPAAAPAAKPAKAAKGKPEAMDDDEEEAAPPAKEAKPAKGKDAKDARPAKAEEPKAKGKATKEAPPAKEAKPAKGKDAKDAKPAKGKDAKAAKPAAKAKAKPAKAAKPAAKKPAAKAKPAPKKPAKPAPKAKPAKKGKKK